MSDSDFKPTPFGLHCMGELLKEANETEDKAVRLQMLDGEVQLGPDVPTASDRVFRLGGKPVLIVAEDLAQALEGRVLDVHADQAEGKMEIFLSEAPKTLH